MSGYNIEYKQGDSDKAGTVLSDNDGVLDLTAKTVAFVMKRYDTDTPKYRIPCSLGGTYQGVYYSPARGGVTTLFSKANAVIEEGTSTLDTLEAAEYIGEFVVSGTDENGDPFEKHIPSGNNYYHVMIWEKI